MKIFPVGAELFHADGRTNTDMTKLVVAFHNFVNAPQMIKNTIFEDCYMLGI
jgi:hypothetical protein